MHFLVPSVFVPIFSSEDIQQTLDSINQSTLICQQYGVGASTMEIGADYDKELRQQYSGYLVIGDALASAKTASDAVKLALDSITSVAELHTRQAYEDDDATTMPFPIMNVLLSKMGKSTEGVIRSTVDSYDIIRNMKELKNQADFLVNKLNNLKDAWLQRSIMLRTLVERELQHVMNSGTISSTEAILAAKGREAMARERHTT